MENFSSKEHEQKVIVNQMGAFLKSLVEPFSFLFLNSFEFYLEPLEARFNGFFRFWRSWRLPVDTLESNRRLLQLEFLRHLAFK